MKKTTAILLGVNVDHVATLRQARGTRFPDPVYAALVAEEAGADGITMHLREDRRHIQDRDVQTFHSLCQTRLNFEIAPTKEMIDFALKLKPHFCCLVPEKREELTTEGGLNVIKHFIHLKEICHKLQDEGIEVSLFIDPEIEQIEAAKALGAKWIEIHTGQYADAKPSSERLSYLKKIKYAAEYADKLEISVNAGHGLNYNNVSQIAAIPQIKELNIGHAIVSLSIFTGFKEAVVRMKRLMHEARNDYN